MSLNIQLLSEIVMDRPSSLLTALQNKGGLPIVAKYCLKYLSRINGKVITKKCSALVEFLVFMEMH